MLVLTYKAHTRIRTSVAERLSFRISRGTISGLTTADHRMKIMDRDRLSIAIVLMALLLFDETIMSTADPVFGIIHDLIQYNVAGVPVIHQKTEWDFDPEVGKQRRIRYEQENGRYGEIAIAKLGMGTENKGPWGKPVQN